MNLDPISVLLNTPSISRKYANFNRLVWDSVEVRINIMTSQTQYGHAIFGAVPLATEIYGSMNSYCTSAGTGTVADTLPTVQQITHGIHAHVSPGTSAPILFQLPWLSGRDGLAIQDIGNTGAFGGGHQSQWRILGIVVVPLGNATNMASIANGTFTVYARFRGMRLQSPISFQSKKQGRVGKAAESVRSIASALKPLPIVGEIAEGVELVSSAVGAVADFFGFTRESDRGAHDRSVLFLASDLPFADGIDSAPTLSLLKDNKVSIDPAIGGSPGVDCEAFSDVLPREGLITLTAWTAAHTVGTVLLGMGVCPTNYVWPSVGANAYPTPGGWVGEHFQNWRGTMHYTVRIHASNFHRGLLQISWTPTLSVPYSSAGDPTNVSFNRVIEVKGDTVFHFTVGWQSPAVFLRSALRSRNANFNAFTSTWDNGYLDFRVAGELTCPDPTASVQIEVYQSCDPDMVFANPTCLPNDFTFQAEEGSWDDMEDVELVPGSPGDPTAVAMGETVCSIRTLLQRPYFISVLDAVAPTTSVSAPPVNTITGFAVVPVVAPRSINSIGFAHVRMFSNFTTEIPGDPVGTLAPMYLGWRGSLRYKVIINDNPLVSDGTITGNWRLRDASAVHSAWLSNTIYNQSENSNGQTGGLGDFLGGTGSVSYTTGGITLAGQWNGANVLEFNVPHYYPRRFTLVRWCPTTTATDAGFIVGVRGVLTWANGSSTNIRMGRVLRSVGDDFSLVQFRYVPAIQRTV